MDLGARPGFRPDGFPQVVEGTLLDRVAAEEEGGGEEEDYSPWGNRWSEVSNLAF